MYHVFCIQSSVEGHLGSFQLLAIISKTAMNIVEQVSLLCVGASSGYMPRSGIYPEELGPQVVLCSIYWGTSNWFPEWLYQLAIPPSMEECSFFSTSSPASSVTWVFYLSHSDWYGVESQGCFDLCFPDEWGCWTFLYVLLDHSIFLSWKSFV